MLLVNRLRGNECLFLLSVPLATLTYLCQDSMFVIIKNGEIVRLLELATSFCNLRVLNFNDNKHIYILMSTLS